jgi:hypothetical protein
VSFKLKFIMKNCIKLIALVLCISLGNRLIAQNHIPTFDNVYVVANTNLQQIVIDYNLWDNEEANLLVSLKISTDNGKSYTDIQNINIIGDVGENIKIGNDKKIVLNYAGVFLDLSTLKFKLIATDNQPLDINYLVSQVDSTRMRNRLLSIVGDRNPATPEGMKKMTNVKAMLGEVFRKNNYYTTQQKFKYGDYNGENIIGRKVGSMLTPKTYMVVAAHDTYEGSIGANSNGTGLVGMCEIAQILSNYDANNSIIVGAFDFSLEDFVGGNYFISQGGATDEEINSLDGVLDLDKIGHYDNRPKTFPTQHFIPVKDCINEDFLVANEYRADFVRVVSNESSFELGNIFKASAKQYVPELKVNVEKHQGYGEVISQNGFHFQQSDHVPFWYIKRKAIWINDAKGGDRDDDSPTDTEDKINYRFLTQVVKASLASIIKLADIQHSGYVESKISMINSLQLSNK